jgi:hypothetical protein
MGGPCSTNGGEVDRVEIIGGKARGKETARKTKGGWIILHEMLGNYRVASRVVLSSI